MTPEVTTATQLDAMSPDERHQHFMDSIVWDPATLPEHYQNRLRAQADRVLAREQATSRPDDGDDVVPF